MVQTDLFFLLPCCIKKNKKQNKTMLWVFPACLAKLWPYLNPVMTAIASVE